MDMGYGYRRIDGDGVLEADIRAVELLYIRT